jgi:hypothetical protein
VIEPIPVLPAVTFPVGSSSSNPPGRIMVHGNAVRRERFKSAASLALEGVILKVVLTLGCEREAGKGREAARLTRSKLR